MGNLTRHKGGGVATKAAGNPEGKGLNGFLLDWYRTEPRGVIVKPRRQVLAEFFTSMLILSANFKYKPAVDVTNYLYFVDGEWLLSLIAPNSTAMAMQHYPHMAGTASSLMGVMTFGSGAIFGAIVGQTFDGTIAPMTTMYAVTAPARTAPPSRCAAGITRRVTMRTAMSAITPMMR